MTLSAFAKNLAPWIIALLAIALRLRNIATQAWYPDEGAFTELALSLWRHGLPSIGAIKQTALLPMGCSWLAPALAAPWAALAASPIAGVRAWTAVLAGLSVLGLFKLGEKVKHPLAGAAAGLSLALWPLAQRLGAWGTYHHLAAALLVLCAWAAADFQERPERKRWLLLCAAAGVTVAAAYWTFWLGLLPLAFAWRKERRAWLPLGLLLLALPLSVAMLLGYAADPASFAIDLQALSGLTRATLPDWLQRIAPLYSLWMVGKSFPPFAAGLVALLALGFRDLRARSLSPLGAAALALSLGSMDVFRQRQNLEGFPYPLVLVLPAACLGLGSIAAWSFDAFQAKRPRWVLGVAALVLVFLPGAKFPVMEQLSAPPKDARELLAKAAAELKPGDLVIGQAALNWGVPSGVKALQFDDLAVMKGEAVAFLPAGLPPTRFVFRAELEDTRWLVVSPYTHGFTFTQGACLLLGLQAEQRGFYKTWSNGTYTVYENPRHTGKRPAYAERILAYYNLYDQAALEALQRHDLLTARFALQQGLPYPEGDVAGRKRTLAMVEAQLKETSGKPLH